MNNKISPKIQTIHGVKKDECNHGACCLSMSVCKSKEIGSSIFPVACKVGRKEGGNNNIIREEGWILIPKKIK